MYSSNIDFLPDWPYRPYSIWISRRIHRRVAPGDPMAERATRHLAISFAAGNSGHGKEGLPRPVCPRGPGLRRPARLLHCTVRNAPVASICNLGAGNYRLRLFKNAWMQGPRNPEERGVRFAYVERRGMRETPQTGVFQQPEKTKPGGTGKWQSRRSVYWERD